MLDADMVDEVKKVSDSYGMALASYLRNLIREALNVERHGVYAPAALRRIMAVHVLAEMGFVYIPVDLLAEPRRSRERGFEVGRLASRVGLEFTQLLEVMGYLRKLAIVAGDRVVIPVSSIPHASLKEFILGLALGMNLRVAEEEDAIVVHTG